MSLSLFTLAPIPPCKHKIWSSITAANGRYSKKLFISLKRESSLSLSSSRRFSHSFWKPNEELIKIYNVVQITNQGFLVSNEYVLINYKKQQVAFSRYGW